MKQKFDLPVSPHVDILVYPDAASLARAAAEHILETISAAVRVSGKGSLVLSGGSTPQAVYTLLGQVEYAWRIDWPRLHVFWGDERMVPPDHEYSNYHMAWEALLSKVPLPAQNIHRIHGELDAGRAAETYEQQVQAYFRDHPQSAEGKRAFDLVLLGLGEDGHVASLFPGSPVLDEQERWVSAVEHHVPPPPLVDRVTLTLPAINSASQVTFIVAGEGKAAVVRRVLGENNTAERLPAQRVRPSSGRLLWLMDAAAPQKLNQ